MALFVGRLAESTTARDLEDVFNKYGRVVRCDFKRNFAFVTYEDERDAEDAISEMNGRELGESRSITVEWTKGSGRYNENRRRHSPYRPSYRGRDRSPSPRYRRSPSPRYRRRRSYSRSRSRSRDRRRRSPSPDRRRRRSPSPYRRRSPSPPYRKRDFRSRSRSGSPVCEQRRSFRERSKSGSKSKSKSKSKSPASSDN